MQWLLAFNSIIRVLFCNACLMHDTTYAFDFQSARASVNLSAFATTLASTLLFYFSLAITGAVINPCMHWHTVLPGRDISFGRMFITSFLACILLCSCWKIKFSLNFQVSCKKLCVTFVVIFKESGNGYNIIRIR